MKKRIMSSLLIIVFLLQLGIVPMWSAESHEDMETGIVQQPGGDPEQQPGGDPEQQPGGDPEQQPGGDPEQQPGGDSTHIPTVLPSFPDQELLDLPQVVSSEPKDVTQLLKDGGKVTSAVWQGNKEIIPDGQTVTLDVTKPFLFKLAIDVPVEGDYFVENPTADDIPEAERANYVHYGDYAEFKIGVKLNLEGEQNTRELLFGQYTVGHITFSNKGEELWAKVLFDGEDIIFTPDQQTSINSVSVACDAEFKSNQTGEGTDPGEYYVVVILEKNYQVLKPMPVMAYTLTKTGTVSNAKDQIQWKITVGKTADGSPADLKGYVLTDNLENVGKYVAGSFQVNNRNCEVSYTGEPSDEGKGGVLSYTFPENSNGEQVVTFLTQIPKSLVVSGEQRTVINKAILTNPADAEFNEQATGNVIYQAPVWITKEGQSKDGSGQDYAKNRELTWTITFNQGNYDLSGADVTITDKLTTSDPSAPRLMLKSVNWSDEVGASGSLNNAGSLVEGAVGDIGENNTFTIKNYDTASPQKGVYEFQGVFKNVKSTTTLILTFAVADTDFSMQKYTYNNSATIAFTWDGTNGTSTGVAPGISIGHNSLTKQGTLDRSTGIITWTITVDSKNQSALTQLYLYDILSVSGENLSGEADNFDYTGLVAGKYQRFVPGSESENVKITPTDISSNQTVHGQLLKIASANDDPFIGGAAFTFTFKTQVTDPKYFFVNSKDNKLSNTIYLYNGPVKLNVAHGNVNYVSNVIEKDVVSHATAEKVYQDPSDCVWVNKEEGGAGDAFNYDNRSVLYRFHINANGMDFSTMEDATGQTAGKVTMTDTLPDGFVWDESSIYVYMADKSANDRKVEATQRITTPEEMPEIKISPDQRTLSVTFPSLAEPKMIVTKAVMTQEKAEALFAGNGNKLEGIASRNTGFLSAENWTQNPSDYEDIYVASTILDKQYSKLEAGVVQWAVDYTPYKISHNNAVITDTLPQGLEMRTDSTGKLLLESVTLHELTLQANGAYVLGDPLTVTHEQVNYDLESRTLTFKVPQTDRSYRLTYITDVTAEAGTLSNKVELVASGVQTGTGSKKNYVVASSDASATMKITGSVTIHKTTATDVPLPGATFEIQTQEGLTFRAGTTNQAGDLIMRGLPVGAYTLVETLAPMGYEESDLPYDVSVSRKQDALGMNVRIQSNDSGEITIINYTQEQKQEDLGTLEVSKQVNGNAADSSVQFDFILELNGADGTYSYVKKAGDVNVGSGAIKSGDTFQLSAGQRLVIPDLPKDATYTITEQLADDAYYTDTAVQSGQIKAGDTVTAAFVNIKTGKLEISKTVEGNNPQPEDSFAFQVELKRGGVALSGAFACIDVDGTPRTIQSGDTIFLKANQKLTITGLPDETAFSVTETDSKGHYPNTVKVTGNVESGRTAMAVFTNTTTGQLEILKTVEGANPNPEDEFVFQINLQSVANGVALSGAFPYTAPNGDEKSVSDGAHVTLKAGERIVIKGLPDGAYYIVSEIDAKGHYSATAKLENTVVGGVMRQAAFINLTTGDLTITKQLKGDSINIGDTFQFQVDLTLNGQAVQGTLRYTGGGVADGTLVSGGVVTLGHQQGITIHGLPHGTQYTIKELDSKDYVLAKTGDTGTIVGGQTQTAAFENTRNSSGGGGTPTVPPVVPPVVVPPVEPPVTPPVEPVQPDQPENPVRPVPPPGFEDAPHLRPDEVDNPIIADSPDRIVVIDDQDVPLGYFTKEVVEEDVFEYIDEEGVPLANFEFADVPNTGDAFSGALWMGMLLLSLGGLVLVTMSRPNQSKRFKDTH